MDSALEVPVRKPRLRRRRLLIGASALLFVGTAIGGYVYYRFFAARVQLREVIAELDRSDPAWRLEDLEASRKPVPDERNSGAIILAGAAPRPPNQWIRDETHALVKGLAPQEQLTGAQSQALRVDLEKAAAVLATVRAIKDLPDGRYPITYSATGFGTLLPHLQEARGVADLLTADAMLRAQDGDSDGAFDSCCAALNAGRSIGDEPFLISFLVRVACRNVALAQVERVLAQGQPSPAAMLRLEKLLEAEQHHPALEISFRGERAVSNRAIQELENGRMTVAQLTGGVSRGWTRTLKNYRLDFLVNWGGFGDVAANHAAVLSFLTQAIAIAKLPVEERAERYRELEAILPSQPYLARTIVPAVVKVAEADRRTQAQLRCARLLLATERYRQEHHRWPSALAGLVPKYIGAIPTDPYDGKSLRYRRVSDGVVIYSVGADLEDNGGQLGKSPAEQGYDWGFRLWDVDHRRQPPSKAPDPPTR